MTKKQKRASGTIMELRGVFQPERTSEPIASVAGRLLNGKSLLDAEAWLHGIVMTDDQVLDDERTHALTLIGAIAGMRRLAGSALTQR
jgi:hypothetical protein